MVTLFLVVFLDLVGFGMIIPVFPFYAEQVGVDPAAVIFFLGLYSLGQLVGAPVWGVLSDRIGRRPVLLATLLANAAASSMLAFSHTGLLLGVSRVLAGLAAGNISAAYAYTTDITTNETRPKALGLLGSAFGLGFILGPAMGGLLAGNQQGDPNALARVAHGAAIMSLVAFVLTLVRLPESLPPEKRSQPHAPRAGMHTFFTRPGLRDLLIASVVVVSAVSLLQSTLALWAARELQVGPRGLGGIFGFAGVISVVIQAGVIGMLTRRFGALRLARVGAVLVGIGMVLVPPMHTVATLLIALAVFGVGSALFNPSMSGLVSATAAPQERGAVLGAYQGAASLGRVLGPFTASAVAKFGALSWPFLVGGVISVVGAMLIRDRRRE